MIYPQHKQTAYCLSLIFYAIAMVFFAIVRLFGIAWFQIAPLGVELDIVTNAIISSMCWIIGSAITLRTLTSLTWQTVFYMCVIAKAGQLIFALLYFPYWLDYLYDIVFIITVVVIKNYDKEMAIGRAALYIIGINLYTLIMTYGRGYALISKYNAIWQIIAVLDYYLLLVILYTLKGASEMRPTPGCLFFFGRFDKVARTIGHVILMPFTMFKK